TSLAEVIRRVAPNMVGSPGGQFGQSTKVRGRTQNSFITPEPEPVVVVDGVRVEDASTALDLIRPSDVRTLEVLPGAAAGWQFGSSGAAGVIRVTTFRGGTQSSPPGVENCTVPDFPRG
ncbi:MAG TPA: TonB-dependent receptor plug domain-containing protein, partial [Longimicrobiales bacterium]|nr:TonB-dependent receptor plug domain-containing protein [Longimicrobiales bacterium]